MGYGCGKGRGKRDVEGMMERGSGGWGEV